MDNPGLFSLGDYSPTAAVTNEVITQGVDDAGAARAYIANLEGMIGANIQINFNYGSGGTTLKVIVETSLDQGATWIEVWRAAFTTVSAERVINLTNAAKTTPYTPAVLSDDTSVDGILGDRWRAKVTSTGTYAGNTSLAVRLNAR
jgi:hypothetical protein